MDEKEIRHLATLARIRITESETRAVAEKLARVVGYVSLIQSAQVPSVEIPEAEILRNVMREDGTPHKTGVYTKDILRNVPNREGDYVKVKKIL